MKLKIIASTLCLFVMLGGMPVFAEAGGTGLTRGTTSSEEGSGGTSADDVTAVPINAEIPTSDFVLSKALTTERYYFVEGNSLLEGWIIYKDEKYEAKVNGKRVEKTRKVPVYNSKVKFSFGSKEYTTFLEGIRSDAIASTQKGLEVFKERKEGNPEEFSLVQDWGNVLNYLGDPKVVSSSYKTMFFQLKVGGTAYNLELAKGETQKWIADVLVPHTKKAIFDAGIPYSYNVYLIKSALAVPLSGLNIEATELEKVFEVGFEKSFDYYVHPFAGAVKGVEVDPNSATVMTIGTDYGFALNSEYMRLREGELKGEYTGIRAYKGTVPEGVKPEKYLLNGAETELKGKPYIYTLAQTGVPTKFTTTGGVVKPDLASSANLFIAPEYRYDFVDDIFYEGGIVWDSAEKYSTSDLISLGDLASKELSLDDLHLMNYDGNNIMVQMALRTTFAVGDTVLPTGRIARIRSINGVDVNKLEYVGEDGYLTSFDEILTDGVAKVGFEKITKGYYIVLNKLNYAEILKNFKTNQGVEPRIVTLNETVASVTEKLKSLYLSVEGNTEESWVALESGGTSSVSGEVVSSVPDEKAEGISVTLSPRAIGIVLFALAIILVIVIIVCRGKKKKANKASKVNAKK